MGSLILQTPTPVIRPVHSEKDCAYCTGKYNCAKAGRQFFEEEKYPPCANYKDTLEEFEKEAAFITKCKELQQIKTPVPRPEGSPKDCLYCKRLGEGNLFHGQSKTRQGEGIICGRYNELNIRPAKEEPHCIYCLTNYLCIRSRVVRDGKTPCDKYKEYAVEKTE